MAQTPQFFGGFGSEADLCSRQHTSSGHILRIGVIQEARCLAERGSETRRPFNGSRDPFNGAALSASQQGRARL